MNKYTSNIQALLIIPCALALHAEAQGANNKSVFDEPSKYSYPVSVREQKVSKFNDRISRIESLTDNWDGYGASSISSAVIHNTFFFLESIPPNLLLDFHPSNIIPSPYGTIYIEIEKGGNDISIEIGKSEMSYIADIGQETYEDENITINMGYYDSEGIVNTLKKIL